MDFRLKVFQTVAQKLSFTKAANELFITQPAVTKHISELESQLKARLFDRNGNTIALTSAGQVLLRYSQQIFKLYAQLENELALQSGMLQGNLRIGASTTLAHYVLPSLVASFKKSYPSLSIYFVHGNSEYIEQQIIHEKLDIALVEGISHHPQINYEPFVKDEIVLAARTHNKLVVRNEIKPEALRHIPLVMREQGSGTLDVIQKALQKVNLLFKDLQIEIYIDSTEGIKQYLMHSDCAAFLSIHSIEKELKQNSLSIVDIKGVSIDRTFQFIQLHGPQQKSAEIFKRFCQSHYNLK